MKLRMKIKGNGSEAGPGRREARIQEIAELHLSYEGGGCEIPIRTPDLSAHGMFVNTSTHFPEGAIVNLRFRLARSNIEIQTRGEVRYCLPGVGIGVEFVGIEREAIRAIEKELKSFFTPRRGRSLPAGSRRFSR
jgi:hypothetical protein